MALMFSRLANNFAKNGYYPTDSVTIERSLSALDLGGVNLSILDPCCGEGTALAEVKHHLTEAGAVVQAYGVEYNAERRSQRCERHDDQGEKFWIAIFESTLR